ncbi:MAG: response regulator transcription factor [Bacteroidota bacterium]
MEQHHILLVEDDLNLGFLLVELLEDEGYFVKLCKDGASSIQAFGRQHFDLCIFDVMLPQMDGYMVAKEIRAADPEIPFLFLTAKSRKEDKMQGYRLGAEDFITKPFDEDLLLCKLHVILRRQQLELEQQQQPVAFQIGQFHYDYSMQELRFGTEIKRITEKENEILRLLCLHKNRILKREEAVAKIYGKFDYFLGRSFDVFISRLRKLLKPDPAISIENVFKVGFILKVEE